MSEGTTITPMPFHEVAGLFPLMTDEEYQELLTDIECHGLREPIWTYQGKIIDGRNRYLACQALEREPVYQEWSGEGSLADFIVSLNLKRRHLTISQKAIIAVEIEKHLAQEAGRRRLANLKRGNTLPDVRFSEHREHGRSSLLAGRRVGISKDTVLEAKQVARQAPELREAILSGVLKLSEAKLVAKLPEPQRAAVVSKVQSGEAKNAKGALLGLRQAAIEARVQAEPTRPCVNRAAWEQWLPEQPRCDVLLTDPPYSTEIEDIEGFAACWLLAALSKVKESGRAYVCIGGYPRELLAYLTVPVPEHLYLDQLLIWAYKNTLGPSPTRRYKQNWQAILLYTGREAPSLDCPLLTEQFAFQDINAPDGRQGNRYHRWQKPDELAERLIHHSTKPGETVLDCFAGTGTFLLAAHRLGRVALGCECSEEMLRLAEKRGCLIVKPDSDGLHAAVGEGA